MAMMRIPESSIGEELLREGRPQCGQASAADETSWPQSGHLRRLTGLILDAVLCRLSVPAVICEARLTATWPASLPRTDRTALAVIAAFTGFRLVLAAVVGLGVDETYTVSVAHDLDLSYFDHPPLQYWITHLTLAFLGDGRAVRLPFIALFAGTSWLIYRLTQTLFGERAALVALLALNASAFFTFAAGTFVLPDGPLLFALAGAAVVLARALCSEDGIRAGSPVAWLKAGAWLGIAGLAKYQATLFALGLLTFLVTVPAHRRLLRSPAPWLAALLALVLASPVFVWNMEHHWVSLGFQLGRGGTTGGLHPLYLLVNLAGQAIWLLPWIFVGLVLAAWRALRQGRAAESHWFCLSLALPPIAIFTLVPLWGRIGLPHWPMPGWLFLYPLLGAYAVRFIARERLRRLGVASAAAVVILGALAAGEAATGYGRLLAPRLFAAGDPTLDALEWGQLAEELRLRGLLASRVFVITTSWISAGKIAAALHDSVPVVIFGNNPRQFAFRYDPRSLLGRDAIVIGPADSMSGMASGLRPYFTSIEQLRPVWLGRRGAREIELRLLSAHDLQAPLPEPAWRHPGG